MRKILFHVAVLMLLSCGLTFAQQYKVLWSFGGAAAGDGAQPMGQLVADAVGNLYGTTYYGGSTNGAICSGGCGTVFELSPSKDGSWRIGHLHFLREPCW